MPVVPVDLSEDELRGPLQWRTRRQRRVIDSVAVLVVLAAGALIAVPGGADDRLGRAVGGFAVLVVVVCSWVWLRLPGSRPIPWVIGIVAALALSLTVHLGGEVVDRAELARTGNVRLAEVVRVTQEVDSRGGTTSTYDLEHVDNSPACATISTGPGAPTFAEGQFVTIVEDPQCTWGPLLQTDLHYGDRLGLATGGLGVFTTAAAFGVHGYRRRCVLV